MDQQTLNADFHELLDLESLDRDLFRARRHEISINPQLFGGEVLAQAPQPVLGICAGLQLLVRSAGGRIAAMANTPGEYGFCTIEVVQGGGLFAGLPPRVDVYQEHYDEVVEPPGGCELLATSPVCPVQAVAWKTRPWWGTQFHPEWHDRVHPHGRRILENFFALARDALSGTQVRRGRADADA